MKKYILVLLTSILLTGCSIDKTENRSYLMEDESIYENYRGTYIKESTRRVFDQLNEIVMSKNASDSLYFYGQALDNDVILNPEPSIYLDKSDIRDDLFEEIVDKLDATMASGLKTYFNEIKNKDGKVENKKFDKVVIGKDIDEKIFLAIEVIDIKDGKLSNIYEEMTEGKYMLNKVINVDKNKYVEFESINMAGSWNTNIIYGVIFNNYEIEKVNIYVNQFDKGQVSQTDNEELSSVLNYLKLEKTEPIVTYLNNIGKVKTGKQSYKSGPYKVTMITANGENYSRSENNNKRGYISIERN